jgi:uncharacterized membrane-anchored protein
MIPKLLRLSCVMALAFAPAAIAQGEAESAAAESSESDAFTEFMSTIEWTTSGSGGIGNHGAIEVPEGYIFTGQSGTVRLMEAYGNLTSGDELAYIAPSSMDWFAVFEFDPIGYVKDDEKDSLDAGAILEQMREGQKQANEQLAARGMGTLEVVGWQTPPFYNQETNNLEWAVRLRSSDGGEVVNYRTKLLGRRGVMDVVVVCDEDAMSTVIPEYQKLLAGYAFHKDESYAAFTKGDKMAEYGLTGLIVGGGLLAAAKSGLLVKLWKPIAGGLLVVGAVLKRIFTGRSKQSI